MFLYLFIYLLINETQNPSFSDKQIYIINLLIILAKFYIHKSKVIHILHFVTLNLKYTLKPFLIWDHQIRSL